MSKGTRSVSVKGDSYDLQALAAMRRCLDIADAGGPWWAAADAVGAALAAVNGDPIARKDLDENEAWALDAHGELP